MRRKVVVLGGGVGGLAAGWMLGRTGDYEVTVVERAPVTGGACATFRYEDFLLDLGPHKSYSAIPGIMDELKQLMGAELIRHRKSNTIYLFGSFLHYPIRLTDLLPKMGVADIVACAVSAGASALRRGGEPVSYEDYVVRKFGRRLYELVFEPLADKVWGDPATLSADIARTRIPSSGVVDTALRAVGLKRDSALTDAEYFYYPREGFGRIPARMHEEVEATGGRVLVRSQPVAITRSGRTITGVDVEVEGQRRHLPCDLLVSSVPLHQIVSLLGTDGEAETADALAAASRLQYRGACLVYLVLDRERVTDHHWLFFPERDLIFGRVFEQKQMSEAMAPKDRTALCCDFTDDEAGPLWTQTDDALIARCRADLARIGLIRESWVRHGFVKRLPKFYPRYDLRYRQTTSTLYEALKRYEGLLPTGRIGFYNYNNSDHCVDMGKFIAEGLSAGHPTHRIWTELEARVSSYRIVD